MLTWQEAQARLAHPSFSAVHSSIAALPRADWPSLDELNQCLRGAMNRRGVPLRFAEPAAGAVAGQHYELRIAQAGEVATRANWHDVFNALAWTAFPGTKSAISEMHARIIESQGDAELKRRGVARDVLTLFDESGAIVVSESRDVLETLRDFGWKGLFWERRADWLKHVRVYLFGHALMEKMLAPHIGVTAKCVLFEAPRGWLAAHDVGAQVRELDQRAADCFMDPAHLASTRSLQPLPILGIPGWDARGEDEAFYDNTNYFRPGYADGRRVQ